MDFIIRRGEIQDAQAILDLIHELAVFEKLPNEVEITVEDIRKDGFSTAPKFQTFVAEDEEGFVFGMALFYERYSTWKGTVIHLEDLMVTQNNRGVGAGKALYTAVLNYAYERNLKRVCWEVLDWNANAIAFYESTGAVIDKGWYVVKMKDKNLKEFIENK